MEEQEKSNTVNRPELALPAGSLQCALYAFKGGANAVYLGLKDFSARKGAVNFTFEDVRKLKEVCKTQQKKFYVTVNTLVNDDELESVEKLLTQLDYLKPDGVIVQDLGVARLMRERHPSLPLHGSTQLAVHTVEGVKELLDLGFTRVVLSRELSFEEIKHIRKECPFVELKVFIHGALCYGFSGLCMASEHITGRSANRGECAQICRTWFALEDKIKNKVENNWLFSMKDLCLGSLIKQYAQIGIDSLKIEGRMKSPEYVYWCAKYYSLILDDAEQKDIQWALECMKTSFSRATTQGFFNRDAKDLSSKDLSSKNLSSKNSLEGLLTCPDFPSHRGLQVGTIEKVLNGRAIVRFNKPVALRDGLLVISCGEKTIQSAGFGLSFIEGGRSFINAGEVGTINFPTNKFDKKPSFGTPVWCTSRHNQNLPHLNENISLYKLPVDIKIQIFDTSIKITAVSFYTSLGQIEDKKDKKSKDDVCNVFDIDIQKAITNVDLNLLFQKIFQASGESLFTLSHLIVENKSNIENPFIPLSVLKQIRRSFYENLDEKFKTLSDPHVKMPEITQKETLPPRSELGLWDEVAVFQKKKYLCLSPLMFDEEKYLKHLDEIVSEEDVIVGLNNIAQVKWAKRHPNIKVFADFFLYTSNSFAYNELLCQMPNLIGSYETNEKTPFCYVGKNFNVPLFVSRVCLRCNSLGFSCAGCSKDNTYKISQNKKTYNVYCKNCITVVTEDNVN